MEKLLQDVRYAVRTLGRSPGWTTVTILTLAIGIGANAAVFGFVDALLFRPAPAVEQPRTLLSIYTSDFSSGPYGATSYPDFISMINGTTAFQAIAAAAETFAAVRVADSVDRVGLARVTDGYFPLLGIHVQSGRAVAATDTAAGAAGTIMISDALRRRAFAPDVSPLGTVATIDGSSYTIVGVAPPGFRGIDLARPIDVWTGLQPPSDEPAQRQSRGLRVLARLRPGTAIAAARAQLDALSVRLAETYPQTNLGTLEHPLEPRPFRIVNTTRIDPADRSAVVMLSALLTAGVGLVLLLACANAAGLLLARTTARAREFAVRRALGAGSGRGLRQICTETVLLGILAAGVGLLLAAWVSDALPSFLPTDQLDTIDAAPGWRVALATLALSTGAALLVAMLPSLRVLKPALAATLRGAAGDVGERSASRTRGVLVAAQVGIACILLVGAGLLVQSVRRALAADLGFSTRRALLATTELPSTWPQARWLSYYADAEARVRGVAGVESVAWAKTLPFSGVSRRGFQPDGYTAREGEDLELPYNVVSASYFSVMGIRILEGRAFDSRDVAARTPVAIVNDALSRRFFNGRAVGRHLRDSSGTSLEIVGVVPTGPVLTVGEPPRPVVYYPLAQAPSRRMSAVIAVSAAVEAVRESVGRELRTASGDAAIYRVRTLESQIREALTGERLAATLISVSGVLALTLAVVGLYGALAYLVARRTREIGVRVALGAEPRHVMSLVVRQALSMAGAGIAAGIVLAGAAGQTLGTMLYGVSATDPRTYAAVAALLVIVAAAAAYLPARRAARVDPVRAIAQE